LGISQSRRTVDCLLFCAIEILLLTYLLVSPSPFVFYKLARPAAEQ